MSKKLTRLRNLTAMSVVSLALTACGGTDVELNGGVFEMLGVATNGQRTAEPKMRNRPGLVAPPSTASLPQPGARAPVAVASNGEAFPVNPEDAKREKESVILAKHKAFCEKARQRVESGISSTLENSPWGACHRSILRSVTGKDASGLAGLNKPQNSQQQ